MSNTSIPYGNSTAELWLVYLLHLLVITAPIGLLINAMSIRACKRHWCENQPGQHASLMYSASHHQWLMTTFISTFILGMIAIAAAGYYVGIPVVFATAMWWGYRVLKGIATLVHRQALPLAIDWSCDTDQGPGYRLQG